MKVEELDASSITFPPVGLRAKRVQEGLLLQIPFADLERDSDADGLTDLAEERGFPLTRTACSTGTIRSLK